MIIRRTLAYRAHAVLTLARNRVIRRSAVDARRTATRGVRGCRHTSAIAQPIVIFARRDDALPIRATSSRFGVVRRVAVDDIRIVHRTA